MNGIEVASSAILAVALATPAKAGCEVDISDYVGWEIIYSGTVTGYVDDNGQIEDGFEGCERGRVLIVDRTKTVTCNEYNYAYAFRPDIVVMSDGFNFEAFIDDEMFEIRR